MALRDGLRSGDIHVPGSRRYADPASFLLTPQQWEPKRLEFCHLVGKPASAADALALAGDELHATFDTKVIAATAPESPYVLDGILGNQTDLPVTEHATDTHGATLANFALFDLLGLQLSPRIRDLGKITPLPDGAERGLRVPLPVRREDAHPPPQRRPHHGHVGRPA